MTTNFDAARESLKKTAASYRGVRLSFAESGAPTDATLVEYGGNLRRAFASSSLQDFSAMAGRLASPSLRYKGLSGLGDSDARWFLPASAYVWGLFYNPRVLKSRGIEPPQDLDALEAACRALKGSGVVPVALGNSHGWPLLAWFAQIDLIRNGPESYARLLEGRRAFSSPDAMAALAELDGLLADGFLSADAPGKVWTEAIRELEEGKAAFALMGSYAIDYARKPESLAFALIGERGSKGAPRALLGSTAGFVFPVRAGGAGGNRDGALALADAWVAAGSSGLADDGFRVPASKPGEGRAGAARRSPIQAATTAALEAGSRVLPLIDAEPPDKAAYALRDAFRGIPARGLGSKAAIQDFARGLDAAAKAGSP